MMEVKTREGVWGWTVRGLELALALGCVVLSVALKLTVDAHGPLWLDEAWTGAVVGAHGFRAFARQAWLDVNPPLYFIFMHGWTGIFGLSAASLRAPSVIFAVATPFAAALLRTPGLSGPERLTWAAVLGLVAPAILFAQEARGYALLILISLVQTVAFVRLIRQGSSGAAAAWAAAAVIAILTHYHMLFLVGIEGLLVLIVYRRGALKLWPALLVFLPVVVWMAFHAVRVAAFSRMDVAWYPPLSPRSFEEGLDAFVGGWPILAGMATVAVAGVVVERAMSRRAAAFSPGEGALWLAVLAAVLSAAIVLLMGWMRPTFTARYLAPYAPAALLGLVLAARNLSDEGGRLARIALMLMVVGGAVHLAVTQDARARRVYQYQTASEALARAGVKRLVFLWDNPTDRALEPEERDALAGFFFRRMGSPVQVIGVRPAPGADPNPLIVKAAQGPDVGVLWLYDLRVPGSEARHAPPRLETLDGGLRCRRYVGGAFGVTPSLGVVGCVRAPASLPPPPAPT